jgi:hypothetical protein
MFDLLDPVDAAEWHLGHDCEPGAWQAYREYVAACEVENLEHHPYHVWDMLDRPNGPI